MLAPAGGCGDLATDAEASVVFGQSSPPAVAALRSAANGDRVDFDPRRIGCDRNRVDFDPCRIGCHRDRIDLDPCRIDSDRDCIDSDRDRIDCDPCRIGFSRPYGRD